MRVEKKSPNQDDLRVLLVGLLISLMIYFVVAPVINATCTVTDNGSIILKLPSNE